MTSNNSDPWKQMDRPNQSSNVNARRVDPSLPWGLFWAIDSDGMCLLILKHDPGNQPKNKLPKLRGLEVENRTPVSDGLALLVIRLVDSDQREIFHILCRDIVSSTHQAMTEEDAVERFLARTWRWHKLLRGGHDGRLSDEEQKGLIGELNVLKRVLLSSVGSSSGVKSWTGPLGAPKDFELGRICIEAKARRGAATPFVMISSEHQLDTDGVDGLYLCVTEVTEGAEEDDEAVTISDVAKEISDELDAVDPFSLELFEERLSASGFRWVDDYSDKRWLVGPMHIFDVRDEFPRITSSTIHGGVNGVRYSVSLPECEPFRSDIVELRERVSGGLNED